MIYQSNFSLDRVYKYFNYLDSTYKIVDFFDKGGIFYNGKVYLSNLWGYVPRILYEDKPPYFGGGYVTHILYPGSAEKGHFTGALSWTASYIDFGFIGVIFNGLITGIALRVLYDVFKYSGSIFSFILFVQFSYTPIFKYVPVFAIMLIFVVLVNILRLRIK